MNRNIQLKTVTPTKQIASAQVTRGISFSGFPCSSPPSCQAKTAANKKEEAHGKSRPDEEIPIAPVKSLYIKMNRSHGGDHEIRSPLRIRLTETKRVSDGEECQQASRDSIEHGWFQGLSPQEISEENITNETARPAHRRVLCQRPVYI